MSLGVIDQALMSLRDDINRPPAYQDRIDNPQDYRVLTDSETGKIMTHKMADSGNIAYPMIQLQEDGTLRDYGKDFVGAKEAALTTGNYKKFDTEKEAQEYARGGYKTDEFNKYYEPPPMQLQGHPQLYPEHYFEPGLRNVAPVIEFGFGGLSKIAANIASKTKMYSDQVVDRIARMTTPRTTYHGGEKNIGTLRTTYDRSMQGEKIDDDTLFRPTFSSRFPQTGPPTTKTQSTPFQAGLYTAGKKVAEDYASPSRKALYEIDTSVAKKIYDFNKPSKFIGKKLDEEIKLAEEAKDLRKVRELESLKGAKNSLLKVTPTQRDFLEANGYDAIRTLNASGPKTDLKRTVILLRPEKYKFKEIPK